MHMMILMFLVLKLANDVLDRWEILIPSVAELAIPPPHVWEYVWIGSIIPTMCGLMSLSKNRLGLLNVFYFGIILVGVLPILTAGGIMASSFMDYWTRRKTRDMLFGYPLVCLWYIFFAFALQIHLAQLYFAHELRKAWHPPKVTPAKSM
jgi:hypothetical protein